VVVYEGVRYRWAPGVLRESTSLGNKNHERHDDNNENAFDEKKNSNNTSIHKINEQISPQPAASSLLLSVTANVTATITSDRK
jgi:hypothetical protein